MQSIPTRIERLSDSEFFFEWNDGAKFSVPFIELRFECPCAGCVNEITGQRMIQKSHIKSDVRAVEVALVGRYAIKIDWSDGHSTGMYEFGRLKEICVKVGKSLTHGTGANAAPNGPQEPICG